MTERKTPPSFEEVEERIQTHEGKHAVVVELLEYLLQELSPGGKMHPDSPSLCCEGKPNKECPGWCEALSEVGEGAHGTAMAWEAYDGTEATGQKARGHQVNQTVH